MRISRTIDSRLSSLAIYQSQFYLANLKRKYNNNQPGGVNIVAANASYGGPYMSAIELDGI